MLTGKRFNDCNESEDSCNIPVLNSALQVTRNTLFSDVTLHHFNALILIHYFDKSRFFYILLIEQVTILQNKCWMVFVREFPCVFSV